MRRYSNDKFYYWRDELTNPKVNEEKRAEKDKKIHWVFPVVR